MSPRNARLLGLILAALLGGVVFGALCVSAFYSIWWALGAPPFAGDRTPTTVYALFVSAIVVGAVEGVRRGRKNRQ